MGICASCLGLNRQAAREVSSFCSWQRRPLADLVKASESEGLLYEDAAQPQYGTVTPGATLPEPDPEELRREREVLERICAQTSKCAPSPACPLSNHTLTCLKRAHRRPPSRLETRQRLSIPS